MPNTHDIFAKKVFSDKTVFAELLRQFCPPDMARRLDYETLEPGDTAFINRDFGEGFMDLVFDCRLTDGQPTSIIFLLENRTHIPRFKELQLLYYQVCKWIRLGPEVKKLPPVIATVLYHGKRAWKKQPFLASYWPLASHFSAVHP